MAMIRETIVTTVDKAGRAHIAPFGLTAHEEGWIIAPFRPSTTLDNLLAVPCAVANFTDDVRPFAGCVTGRRRDWPLLAITDFAAPRLSDALAHAELSVETIEDHPQRPRFFCRVLRLEQHGTFLGLNRAKAAVVEAAILASRLDLLPRERIERELAVHRSAIDKTAGAEEQEAWSWIEEMVAQHFDRGQS